MLKIREKRSENRAILKEAKDIFILKTGLEPKKHRAKLQKLKDQIKKERLLTQKKQQN